MRKILLVFWGIALGITASAQSLDYITFRTVSGMEASLPVDGLKITFEGTQLHAVAQEQKADFNLMDMAMMFFSSTATAIDRVENVVENVSIVNGRMVVDVPEGTEIQVFGADGRRIGENSLLKGMYLVKVNGRTYKMMAR